MTDRRRGRPALIPLSEPATIADGRPVGEVAGLFDEWLQIRLATNRISSQRTIDGYRDDMARWATMLAPAGDGPAWDRLRLADLTGERIEAALAEMTRAELSVSARKRALAPLRGFCGWLARNGRLPHNPADSEDLAVRSAPTRLPVAFSEDELARITAAVRVHGQHQREALRWPNRDLAVLVLLGGCGLRSSEVCTLQCSSLANLDDDDPSVWVRGKGARERVVPIGPNLAEQLRRYRDERIDRSAQTSALSMKPSSAFIVQTDGRPITHSVLTGWVRRWLLEAGVSPRSGALIHALRHTAADGWLDNGATLAEVQALLGHASIGTTGVYTKVRDARLHDAVRAGRLEQQISHGRSADGSPRV